MQIIQFTMMMLHGSLGGKIKRALIGQKKKKK